MIALMACSGGAQRADYSEQTCQAEGYAILD